MHIQQKRPEDSKTCLLWEWSDQGCEVTNLEKRIWELEDEKNRECGRF